MVMNYVPPKSRRAAATSRGVVASRGMASIGGSYNSGAGQGVSPSLLRGFFSNNSRPRQASGLLAPVGGKRFSAAIFNGKVVGYAGPKPIRWEGNTPIIASRSPSAAAPVAANPTATATTAGQAAQPNLYDQLQQFQNQANAANEARYQQGLGLLNANRGQMLGTLDEQEKAMMALAAGDTGAALSRERQALKQQQGLLQQDLAGRGLFPTTIGASLDRGLRDDSRRREEDIHERNRQAELAMRQWLTGTRLNALQGTTGDTVNFIERRTDQGPDMGIWAQILAQARGQGGAAPATLTPATPRVQASNPSIGNVTGENPPLMPTRPRRKNDPGVDIWPTRKTPAKQVKRRMDLPYA